MHTEHNTSLKSGRMATGGAWYFPLLAKLISPSLSLSKKMPIFFVRSSREWTVKNKKSVSQEKHLKNDILEYWLTFELSSFSKENCEKPSFENTIIFGEKWAFVDKNERNFFFMGK